MANALAKHAQNWWILTYIQFLRVREGWIWMLVMGPLFPLSILLFLRFFAAGASLEQVTYIVTGSMVYSLVMSTTISMGQQLSDQKHSRHFEYYVSLPVRKVSFVLSVMTEGLAAALPGCLILGAVGVLVYDLPLTFTPALIPFALLSLTSMAGFGTFIGFWSPSRLIASYSTQALALVINFLSPVMIPASSLPLPLQYLSLVLPSTYVAAGFRELLLQGWSPVVGHSMLVLCGFTALSTWLVIRKIDWRGQE